MRKIALLTLVLASSTLSNTATAATVLKSSSSPAVPTVSAGAAAGKTSAEATNDPLEGLNRGIFKFNLEFDRHIARPFIRAYDYIPADQRRNISNALGNLMEPLNAVHGILLLNPNIFFTSLWRFILNSTFGLGGIRDFAREQAGLHNMDQNLGKTLGHYGVGSGPYIVLPLLGPSDARDTTGKIGDWFLDPTEWVFTTPESIGQGVANGIDTRDNEQGIINHLFYESLDPYVATRSAYQQHEIFKQKHY